MTLVILPSAREDLAAGSDFYVPTRKGALQFAINDLKLNHARYAALDEHIAGN